MLGSPWGEPFWEETLGDTILPPTFVKQLRGRPKRRREGWEGARGRMGRVMHCAIFRQMVHKRGKCPKNPANYVEKVPEKGLQRENK